MYLMEGAPKALIRLTHEAQGRSGDLSETNTSEFLFYHQRISTHG